MNAICTTCGTQFADTPNPPRHCPVCEDDRQYVGLQGQQWTTLDELRRTHKTNRREEEASLISLYIDPRFGIGQRAFLLQTPEGNILWDCISLLDESTAGHVRQLGGIAAIAISHPHYYTSMVEWSRAFDHAPVYLHRADAQWVMRQSDSIRFWESDTQPLPGGCTLIRCGGHFPGAAVLHAPGRINGKGALLTGDTIQVVPDRRHVSFMWSYPNYVPLSAPDVERIVRAVDPFSFDRIYGAFPEMTIVTGGKKVIHDSASRYIRRLRTPLGA